MVSSTQLILRRRNRKARKHSRNTRQTFWWAFFAVIFGNAFILPLGSVAAGAAAMYLTATGDIPTPQDSLSALASQGVTRFCDASNTRLLYSLEDPLGEQRIWVTLNSTPSYVGDALLVMEDADFCNRQGLTR